jgi:microcystin-dependent protein
VGQPYIGEIRIFAGNFAPAGWAFCEGQLLAIAENDALFTLIGTTYGGDGQATFGVPDLRGRLPLHRGSTFIIGEAGGAEEITLAVTQIPGHSHSLLGSTATATAQTPGALVLATAQAQTYFNVPDAPANLSPLAIGAVGGSQPHTNFQSYLCINFIISLFGVFPSQT